MIRKPVYTSIFSNYFGNYEKNQKLQHIECYINISITLQTKFRLPFFNWNKIYSRKVVNGWINKNK